MREWEELKAYCRIEPFGPLREDLRAASIVCWQVNTNPYRTKNAPILEMQNVFESLKSPEATDDDELDREDEERERRIWRKLSLFTQTRGGTVSEKVKKFVEGD